MLFTLMADIQWRGRPRPDRGAKTAKVDQVAPGRSLGPTALSSGAHPENPVLTIGGDALIAGTTEGIHAKAEDMLASWISWMSEHTWAIMVTVLAGADAEYNGDPIADLS